MSEKSLRDRAHDVMLEQMKDNNNPNVEIIHTHLCEVTDEEVLAGIVKEGKSLLGSIKYCAKKANDPKYVNDNVAQVPSTTVFEWVEEYFKTDEPVKPVKVKQPKKKEVKDKTDKAIAETTAKYKEQVAGKAPKEKEGSQLSLFEF